jgi:hypothetical protein
MTPEIEKPLDLFNYLSVVTSIVLGLGITGYFSHLAKLLGGRSKVKWSALYTLWTSLFLPLYVLYWWTFWDYRNQVEWLYLYFLFLVLGPSLLCIITELFFPPLEGELSAVNLEAHYFHVRKPLFTLWSVLQIWAIFCRPLLRDGLTVASLFNGYKLSQMILLVFFISGVIVKKRSFHFFIIIAFWLVIIYIIFLRFKIGGK